MVIDLSETPLTLTCPNCESAIKILVRDVQLEKTVLCSSCQSKIDITCKNPEEIQKMQDSLDDLSDAVKKMNKTIKLTF